MPVISVLMATRNCPQYLREAVASVRAQTLKDWELIIVDESDDGETRKLLKRLAKEDRRITVLERKGLGLAGSLNVALARAKGALLARMDGDDVCTPTRFAEQAAFLRTHPDVGIVGTWATMVDTRGKAMGRIDFPPADDAGCRRMLIRRQPFIHPTIMVRREVMEPYRADYRYAEDYELLARLVRKTRFANIPKPLLKYRNDPQQASIRAAKRTEWNSMKVRWTLIATGAVPRWRVVQLVRPLLMLLVPTRVKLLLLRR